VKPAADSAAEPSSSSLAVIHESDEHTQLTCDTADDTDPEETHSTGGGGSQSLSQKVSYVPVRVCVWSEVNGL